MTLFIGLALVACSNPNANTNNTDQNNGIQKLKRELIITQTTKLIMA